MALYFCFPISKGMYLYLIMWLMQDEFNDGPNLKGITYAICRFIVRPKRMRKYIRRIGQYTRMSNSSELVHRSEMTVALVADSLRGRSQKYADASAAANKPEIPFGKSAHEGSEFLVSISWHCHIGCISSFLDCIRI